MRLFTILCAFAGLNACASYPQFTIWLQDADGWKNARYTGPTGLSSSPGCPDGFRKPTWVEAMAWIESEYGSTLEPPIISQPIIDGAFYYTPFPDESSSDVFTIVIGARGEDFNPTAIEPILRTDIFSATALIHADFSEDQVPTIGRQNSTSGPDFAIDGFLDGRSYQSRFFADEIPDDAVILDFRTDGLAVDEAITPPGFSAQETPFFFETSSFGSQPILFFNALENGGDADIQNIDLLMLPTTLCQAE